MMGGERRAGARGAPSGAPEARGVGASRENAVETYSPLYRDGAAAAPAWVAR